MEQNAANDKSLLIACTVIAVSIVAGVSFMATYGTDARTDMVLKALTAGGVLLGVWYQRQTSEKAAKQVSEVKDDLAARDQKTDATLSDIKNTGEKNHALSNSAMGAQLLVAKVALARIAEMTKEQGDIDAAELAANLYADHQAKQAAIDSGQFT
jgi:hypothetical protein